MSEEKAKTPAKKTEPGKGAKILNWFKTLPQRIAKPFKNMWYELKKVTWPSKEKLIAYSVVVLLFMLFMGIVIGLLDMGASSAVRSLVEATSGGTATVETVEETADEAAETVEETAEEAADEAAEAVEDAAEEVAETAEDAAEEVADTVEEAAETTEEESSGEN